MDSGDAYLELRPLLFSIAYRMVGSVSEAEDLVQEAFLRLHRAVSGGAEVSSARAYLSTVTTRLAIDHLRSARVRRERYVGTWLPEPLMTSPAASADPAGHAETAETLSLAFLVLLERLSPVQRAVSCSTTCSGTATPRWPDWSAIRGQHRQIAARARRHVEVAAPGSRLPGASGRSWASGPRRGRAGRHRQPGRAPVRTPSGTATAAARPPPWPFRPGWGTGRRALLGLARRGRSAGIGDRPAKINGHPGLVLVRPRRPPASASPSTSPTAGSRPSGSIVNPRKPAIWAGGDVAAMISVPQQLSAPVNDYLTE